MANQKLRDGLYFLETGRPRYAEDAFKEGLTYDPSNSKLRTALASIYAGDSGVKLVELTPPLVEIFNKFENQDFTKMDSMKTSEIEALATKLEGKMAERDQKNKTESDKNREKVISDLKQIATAIYSSATIMQLMNVLPYLGKDKLSELDLAIKALRETTLDPEKRIEEERNYLIILSAIRVVSTMKVFFGKDFSEIFDIKRVFPTLCGMEQISLAYATRDIQKSIGFLAEGLTASPNDPEGRKRDQKAKFKSFVDKMKTSKFWSSIDDLLAIDYHKNEQLKAYMDVICITGI